MMSRYFFLLWIILAGAVDLQAQFLPDNYDISGSKLLKSSSGTPLSNTITDILTIGDTVILGTSRGLSISFDRGSSWNNYYGNEAFGDEVIVSVGYNNGILWTATAHSVERDGSVFSEGSGIRFSGDMGNSWSIIQQPVDDPGDSLLIYGINDGISHPKVRALPVTVAINNLAYDIAFTDSTIWIAAFAAGLRKSTDGGKSWQRVLLPSDSLDEIKPSDIIDYALQPVAGNFGPDNWLNHRVFSVVSEGRSTLYVGTAGGINKSTDNGLSWRKFSHKIQTASPSGNFVTALAYNPAEKSIWGATWKAEGITEFYGISYSYDGGETWATTLSGERTHNFGFKGSEIFAASGGGMYRSLNGGITWIMPHNIIDSGTGAILSTRTFYSVSAEGNDIWLGSDNGLVKLSESAVPWEGLWKIYIASQPLETGSETYAYPNPFSPDVESIRIKYSSTDNTSVTIRIFDFGMNLVRTLIQNAFRAGGSDQIDLWDGRDQNGNIVPNGVYIYRIDFDSGEPVFGKILVLL